MDQPLGPKDRDFVCNDCYRSYTVRSRSWRSAEALPCLFCKSRNTTPMIAVEIGMKRIREYSLPIVTSGPDPLIVRAS